MYLYQQDQQIKQQAALNKKELIKKTNKQNLFLQYHNRVIRDSQERATDHLINPIEFQVMVDHEKMREQISK